MRTVLNVLKDKLNTLGYNDSLINSVIMKLNLTDIEQVNSRVENKNELIVVQEYNEPNVEIIQTLLSIDSNIAQVQVLEGDITMSATESAVGTRIAVADYSLYKRSAVIAITTEHKIKIVIYNPTPKIQNLYNGLTYEQTYKKQRDQITREYYEAFVRNGRVTERRVKEFLTMLVSDFVIDEIAVKDANPKIKMYDNEYKYAENLYSYSIRYINLKSNRVDIIERESRIKRLSRNVQAGLVTNDPYIRLDKLPPQVDFPLNTVSYYWLNAGRGQPEEIAIFVAPKVYEQAMFSELKKQDDKISKVAVDVARNFRAETGLEIDTEEIIEVLSKLNPELVCPSIDIIRAYLPNKTDNIEPIRYKYKIITDPADYEEKLYITIADDISRRYKYKLIEDVLNDSNTKIGNKLEYTDEKGQFVRKQSIADFNINAKSVVIRRETFTDISGIPDLLGYIYEDMKYYGTDGLPVPNIEVVFYMPRDVGYGHSSVSMFNGTSGGNSSRLFNSVDDGIVMGNNYRMGGIVLPGSTTVNVRYVNSKGDILKENIIGNVFPNSTYIPDKIPIINDNEGKEWTIETDEFKPFIITNDPSKNIVELKYIEKFSRVYITFTTRDGKKITEDKQEIVQVGTNYNFSNKSSLIDKSGDEWKLLYATPSKLIVKDEEDKNKLSLVYDIERTDVIIRFVSKYGDILAPEKTVQVCVGKVYNAENIPTYITSEDGLGWNYIESSNASVVVKNSEINVINLVYEEAMRKIITRIRNYDGISIRDDSIEFLQVGKSVSTSFDSDLSDFECKEWEIAEIIKDSLVVSENESENVLEAIYKPKLAGVTIRILNMNDKPIKEVMLEQAQIGSVYRIEDKEEIMDNFGLMWMCKEHSEKLIVSSNSAENNIVLRYEPMMSKVTIKYFDIEMNEIASTKYETLQVGSSYKNSPARKVTDNLGKKWIINEAKVPTITVKKYEEENIVSIYYDKETTKVILEFYDAFGNKLRDQLEVDSQIGAELEANLYSKITDYNGGRWSFESSEPKNLTVRETGNLFKLIYDEVKAKVLVKHINVTTQKTIVEDVVTSIKLGGIYVPNIRQKILDKNKWQWKYIGEENISIVTKENEQENIIILTYDEDRAKVILKYRDLQDNKIREDAEKEIQIGKEIKIDPSEHFKDNNGLGWEYSKSVYDSKIIVSGDNIITNYYAPLYANVVTKYVDQNNNEVISNLEEKIQVGKKYESKIINVVKDINGFLWKFDSISEQEVIANEEGNEIICKYNELLADVTINLLDLERKLISEPIINHIQIGRYFEYTPEERYIDSEDKSWLLDSIDYSKIKVSENFEKNVINVSYRKELVELKICFINPAFIPIKNPELVMAQIGSIYDPKPSKELFDDKKIGWEVDESSIPKFKVNRNAADNIININYNKFMVDVSVRFVDDKGELIIEDNVTKHQAGTEFMPNVEDYIYDSEGREWIHSLKVENRFFSSGKKVEPIIVTKYPEKNVLKLNYKPSLTKVTIKYNDPLGNEIKMMQTVDAQIGSKYTPDIIEKIVGNGNVKWMYNPNSNSTIKVDKDSTKNVINLAYEEEKSFVIYKYIDEDNNKLKEDKKILIQIGSIYKPDPDNIVEDSEGKVWEYKSKDRDEFTVQEDDKNNIITLKYMPLKVDVVLKYVTLNGNKIMNNGIVKAQLGSTFKPDIVDDLADDDSKLFKFVKCEPESIVVKEIPIGATSPINLFELTYEAVFSEARIVFQDIDGNKLKDDEVKSLQVGTVFSPGVIQFVKDRKGIQWQIINDKIEPIRVKEDPKENRVLMTYEIAKAEVSIRYKDMDGNIIKEADILNLDIGSEFVPEVQNEYIDDKNRKWLYSMTDPIKLTVGSINNVINIVYQEKKVTTIIKIQSTDGRTLKEDIRTKQQVGSKFNPLPKQKVIYDNNDIWRYAYNSPSDIIISENTEENVIIQYYTSDSPLYKEPEEKKPYFNEEAQKFIDKDLVAQAEADEKARLELEEQKKKELEKAAEEKVEFSDQHLQKLEKNIKLTNSEKDIINKLNDCNTEIIKILHEGLNHASDDYNLEEKLNQVIRAEKKLVEEGLAGIIEEDRTGNKILQIFEAITLSEINDKDFYFLQQKKSILFADYFVNKNVADIEQVTYIIERGKIQREIKIVDAKIARSNKIDPELIKLKVILIYEKAMLDNYYRARSIILDDYFEDEESKEKVSRDVIVMVTNTLPNHAVKLFNKALTLTMAQENELEAVMYLLNPQQLITVTNSINKIQDGKTKKAALKLYKNITGNK